MYKDQDKGAIVLENYDDEAAVWDATTSMLKYPVVGDDIEAVQAVNEFLEVPHDVHPIELDPNQSEIAITGLLRAATFRLEDERDEVYVELELQREAEKLLKDIGVRGYPLSIVLKQV